MCRNTNTINMKITITNKPKTKPRHPNCYCIAIKFMFGDADGYETIKLRIPRNEKNEAELPRFLKFLDNCDKAYPCGRGGCDNYDHVKDYDRYVEGIDNPEDLDDNFIFHWQYDPGCDIQSSYDGYEITYFDENNVEYLVEVKE